MIPILYPSNETSFTSNGLGRLPDATECIVTEERNGAYELRMLYPVTGQHFSDITMNRFIYAVPADGKGKQPFRIYSIGKPLDGIVEINAEHISYQLSHIPVSPFEAGSLAAALVGLKDNAAEACPFTFWTDKTVTGNFKVTEPVSLRSRLGGVEGSLLDVYGTGEYEFDHYTVKLHLHRGTNNGVTLRYSKNITDIKQEENIANTYTGVMPYWKGDVDGTETTVTLPEKVLHSANASNFPYQRTIPLDLSSNFENQPAVSVLRSTALSYMASNNIGVPAVSIDVSFIALWQTEEYKDVANLERVNLCDTVTVEFPALGVSAQAKVVKTEYDVLRDRYQSLELGDAKTNFTQTLSAEISSNTSAMKQLPTKSYMQKAVDHATELITGGLGGHVVMKTNADGEPEEILIMDTDDVNTAVNVIRINQAGIGFSTDGYDGPFSTAWTIDGHFIADFIDTGNLNATLITTGVLKDHGSNFALDLSTGTLTAKKGSINLGSGNFQVTDGGVMTMKQGSISLGSGNFTLTNDGTMTMKKGSINIGDAFKVTTGGALTATNASLKGTVTSENTSTGGKAKLDSSRLEFYASDSSLAEAQVFLQNTGMSEYQGLQLNTRSGNIILGLRSGAGDVYIAKEYSHGWAQSIILRSSEGLRRVDVYYSSYIRFEDINGSTYDITLSTSDLKLKKNVRDSTVKALPIINAIEHKSFEFKDFEKHRECGYIAQQLEEVNEEFVKDVPQGDGSVTKQVNTFELLSYATKAIQELSAKVDALEKRIAELEAKELT